MRLIDSQIASYLKDGIIKIVPDVDQNDISGITLDLHLGDTVSQTTNVSGLPVDIMDPNYRDKLSSKRMSIVNEPFILRPGQLVLGYTREDIEIPDNLVGWLDGKSKLARLGICVHVTAHRIDPGWSGNIVLEIINNGNLDVLLKAGMPIGAISFEKLNGPVDKPYRKKSNASYRNQTKDCL